MLCRYLGNRPWDQQSYEQVQVILATALRGSTYCWERAGSASRHTSRARLPIRDSDGTDGGGLVLLRAARRFSAPAESTPGFADDDGVVGIAVVVLDCDRPDDAAWVISDQISDHRDVLRSGEIHCADRVAVVDKATGGAVGDDLGVDDVDALARDDASMTVDIETAQALLLVGVVLAGPATGQQSYGRNGKDDRRRKRGGYQPIAAKPSPSLPLLALAIVGQELFEALLGQRMVE